MDDERLEANRKFLGMLSEEGRCRDCARPIWWVVTRNGRRMPVTDELLSHFADCPAASKFRQPR